MGDQPTYVSIWLIPYIVEMLQELEIACKYVYFCQKVAQTEFEIQQVQGCTMFPIIPCYSSETAQKTGGFIPKRR